MSNHGQKICACGRSMHHSSRQCALCRYAGEPVDSVSPASVPTIDTDRASRKASAEIHGLRSRYKEALETIDRQQVELDAVNQISQPIEQFVIVPSEGSVGDNEATVFLTASDWHSEEIVHPERVNGVNEHNSEISRFRAINFFQNGLKLTRLIEAGVKVPNIVLPLLGDFCTNDIHDADNAENNDLLPIDAYLRVQETLTSGIDFLLNHTTAKIQVPCHSGNHARTTHKTHLASEKGHSLEYFMYRNLARHYASANDRIEFLIAEGHHSFMECYGLTIRFHHGHAIKYNGGVGGIHIPANKAVAQWNRVRTADLDVFGHFHQSNAGSRFISNGSLIGWNSFAEFIKADYEVPQQQMFVIDKKHGRTCHWPIYVA